MRGARGVPCGYEELAAAHGKEFVALNKVFEDNLIRTAELGVVVITTDRAAHGRAS